MMKEIIFTIVLGLSLAVFMADPVRAEAESEGESEGENNGSIPELGSCLIFMTSLMTLFLTIAMFRIINFTNYHSVLQTKH